jgi:hypothetical protein
MKRFITALVCALFAMVLAACGPNAADHGPGTAGTAPVAPNPLPDSSYRAEITLLNPPQTLRAGEPAPIKVKVKNIANATWPSQGQGPKYKVDVGNHWLDKDGKEVTGDDGRAGLPRDLKPGEEAEVLLTVKAPKTPGDYILEVDMVHEDITWFKWKGSQSTKANVKVQ